MFLRKYSKHELLEVCGDVVERELLSVREIYEKNLKRDPSVDAGKVIWDIMSKDLFEVYRNQLFVDIQVINSKDTDFDVDYDSVISWGGYSFTLWTHELGTRFTILYVITE